VERIRNFGIIAHIDHGKSTLADRLLELTGCLSRRNDSTPTLDSLPVEKERGITVKAQTASMIYHHPALKTVYLLNLIDTPGHVDFTNEVARSLAAMKGALLVVDAVTGIQAQTVAHYWRAKEHGIESIIPVINKVDLDQADADGVAEQICSQLQLYTQPLRVSAKTGFDVEKILEAIVDQLPPEKGSIDHPLEAIVIDSWYKEFRGVICLVHVKHGMLNPSMVIKSAVLDRTFTIEEVGILKPEMLSTKALTAGQVGWVRCGTKNVTDVIIGDTLIASDATGPINVSLPKRVKPIVFAGLYPANREEHEIVADAVQKLLLNDSSVAVEKITSIALGPGWKLGFLGSLHMDVFKQRLEQEFNVDAILTPPNVSYKVVFKRDPNHPQVINSAEEFPSEKAIAGVREFNEPYVRAIIIIPSSCIGAVSKLCSDSRCRDTGIDYLNEHRVKMTVVMPLLEIIGQFNDSLLSITAGYASFDYLLIESRPVDLVKISIKLNGKPFYYLS